jgi:hypothetical protein
MGYNSQSAQATAAVFGRWPINSSREFPIIDNKNGGQGKLEKTPSRRALTMTFETHFLDETLAGRAVV